MYCFKFGHFYAKKIQRFSVSQITDFRPQNIKLSFETDTNQMFMGLEATYSNVTDIEIYYNYIHV